MQKTHTPSKVSILVLDQSSMMTLASIVDPLRAANRLSPAPVKQPIFKWRLLSLSGRDIRLTSDIKIAADALFTQHEKGDLLIVIAGFNHTEQIKTQHVSVLKQAATRFKIIAGVEAGTWVLARAGIIRTQRVTTHWEDLENFAFAYPNLQVVAERFVIDQQIWTSGGASPALDMMLHYIRNFHSASLALDVASAFIYNQTSASSEQQTNVSLGRLAQVEPRLAKAIELMQTHIEEPLTIKQIAKQINISMRMLELISRRYLNITPGAYYLRLRLQSARRLVLDTSLPLMEISIRSGFASHTAFARAFKARYSINPSQLRATYRND